MKTRRSWMMRHSFEFLVAYALFTLALMAIGHALSPTP